MNLHIGMNITMQLTVQLRLFAFLNVVPYIIFARDMFSTIVQDNRPIISCSHVCIFLKIKSLLKAPSSSQVLTPFPCMVDIWKLHHL